MGKIRVTREEIVSEAQKVREFFLLDYARIEAAWGGTLVVTPLNREAINRARSAYQLFGARYPFIERYKEFLDAADAALSQLPSVELTAIVQCETSQTIDIETIAISASQ